MVDAKRLLDALIGALSQGGTQGAPALSERAGQALEAVKGSEAGTLIAEVLGQATQGLREATQQVDRRSGFSADLDHAVAKATGGQSTDELLHKAKEFVGQNPGLAQAALAGVAGLLLTSRKGRGIAANIAGLGGLALVGGLAYKAFQNHQAGQPLLSGAGQGAAQSVPSLPAGSGLRPAPDERSFHPVSATEDDVLLFVRTMVAAAAADGRIDAQERARLIRSLEQAGIDPQATGWLDSELGAPASVDELAAGVETPEKAAQVYTAARVAISADTLQEREFLRQLAEALDLDPNLRAQIDAAAETIRS